MLFRSSNNITTATEVTLGTVELPYGALVTPSPFAHTYAAAFAGAGASVPLLGFGNTLFKGVKKAILENGFLGIFMGGFTASAVGISAALIFGYLASLIFRPKMKN